MMGREFWTALGIIGTQANCIHTWDELMKVAKWIDEYRRKLIKSIWENDSHTRSRK